MNSKNSNTMQNQNNFQTNQINPYPIHPYSNYQNYWLKYNIGQLPDVISPDYFLAAMASGPVTAQHQFADFVGAQRNKTGKVDASMINAVNNYNGDIHNRWMDKRDAFLQDVSRRRYGGRLNRGYKNSIDLKRKNGCHVYPDEPIYR